MFHSGEQQQLSCKFCTSQTIHKTALKRHEGIVHKNDKTIKEDAKYNCNICQYSTAEKGYLSNHIKSQHIYQRFFCNICDYESTQKSHLSTHTKNIHKTGEKVICPDCNKTIKMFNINNHKKLFHSGEHIQYNCDICNFQTIHKFHLKRHKLSVHQKVKRKN